MLPTTSLQRRDWAVDLIVFSLLVAIGVAGRLAQPAWGFTPIAAVGIFAGAYFGWRLAVLVPAAAMLVSNLWLAGYDNLPVMIAVYAGMMSPALLGGWLSKSQPQKRSAWLGRLAVCSVAPATWFFLITNLAVWLFRSDYAMTLAGLIECYAAGIPFYRQMLLGDLFYVPVLVGLAAAVGAAPNGLRLPATVAAKS